MTAEQWDQTDDVARMFRALRKQHTRLDHWLADLQCRYTFCELFRHDIACHPTTDWDELDHQSVQLRWTITDGIDCQDWFENSLSDTSWTYEDEPGREEIRPTTSEYSWVFDIPKVERPEPLHFQELFARYSTLAEMLEQLLKERPYNPRLAHRFRCLHLNPFSKVTFHRAWYTEHVRGLIWGIRDDRAYDRLPILADALEEAGCTDPRILAHCREPYYHSYDCLVLKHMQLFS